MHKQSFDPIVPEQAKILILGSLPGDLSIAQHQYYAHPQNRFWKILYSVFNEEFSPIYTERIAFLHRHQLALWDVCATAIRPGSMDTAISKVVPNAIPELLDKHPSIQAVYFNGQKAQKLFDQFLSRRDSISYRCLPSSSPANAQFSLQKLNEVWQIIQE